MATLEDFFVRKRKSYKDFKKSHKFKKLKKAKSDFNKGHKAMSSNKSMLDIFR